LEILEYCLAKNTIEREQYYLDLCLPKYNILKFAGSPLGRKHSVETIAKMRAKGLSLENLEHLNRMNSSPEHKEHLEHLHKNSELKAQRLAALNLYNTSPENKEHLKRLALQNKGRSRPEGSGKPSISISVFDTLTNERTEYRSISAAARAIGVTEAAISFYTRWLYRMSKRKTI
jgi:group I intron endonuclease